ncbi:hypothetical protein B0A49_12193 [Cryomyces minteri]|uniref:Retrotransposon gag domain-containing protein n=1 Tax=Cryomyces minteri TaxID=331657 RepID=A0A4U0WCM7_9PEZI|nr:hypothetical protein B0A49_12193 [Cryomyces minteri]
MGKWDSKPYGKRPNGLLRPGDQLQLSYGIGDLQPAAGDQLQLSYGMEEDRTKEIHDTFAKFADEMRLLREEMAMRYGTQQAESAALRTDLETLRSLKPNATTSLQDTPSSTIPTIPTMESTTLRTNRSRAAFPDEEPFTGEDATLFPAFMVNLETKWLIDAGVYCSEEERVLYGFSRLRGKATKRILPWIQERLGGQHPLRTEDFRRILKQAFRDPDVRYKALSRLNRMKQGNQDVREFLSEFNQVLVEAGALDWDDNAKK